MLFTLWYKNTFHNDLNITNSPASFLAQHGSNFFYCEAFIRVTNICAFPALFFGVSASFWRHVPILSLVCVVFIDMFVPQISSLEMVNTLLLSAYLFSEKYFRTVAEKETLLFDCCLEEMQIEVWMYAISMSGKGNERQLAVIKHTIFTTI